MDEELPPVEEFINEITEELIKRATVGEEATQSLSGLLTTQEILEEILKRTDHNIELKETYDEKCRSHNQYDMFNLLKIINEFEIDDKMYEALTFRETLIISKLEKGVENPQPNPVGGICINVQKAEGSQPMERQMEEYEIKLMKVLDAEGITDHTRGGSDVENPTPLPSEDRLSLQNCYGYSKMVVHVASQFDVDGINAGSSITSWVDRNLHTLEELRKEFINEPELPNEKSLYTAMKKGWYYLKHTASIESRDDRKLYSIAKAKDYVSEGASIVLERYLAIKRYFGKFELSTCYINGDLCRNIYECFGPESAEVNHKKVDICKIKRTIIEECGLTHQCITVLTLQGQIIKQEWDECDYVLHVNPKANITNEKPSCCEKVLLQDYWENDMQLMSQYLDQRGISMLKNKSYMLDHPELKQILADYVNTILLMRPPDIMNFTFDFFGSFVSSCLPRNEYFE